MTLRRTILMILNRRNPRTPTKRRIWWLQWRLLEDPASEGWHEWPLRAQLQGDEASCR
jgi:hypothetical protein